MTEIISQQKDTRNEPQLFSCGIVQAPLVTSSGVLCGTWRVLSSAASSHVGNGISWKVYEEPGSDLTVIAFEVKPGFDLKADLVSWSEFKKETMDFNHFGFLCSKKNPDFSVNTSAISLFYENHESLIQLKSQVKSCPRLIVTGHGLGGPIASLFTLSLLDSIVPGKKRPLCITYGSPLIGDKGFQEAISSSSTWNSCFLHVVSLKDPLPRALSPHTNAYMPFGTFLFCSDVSSTCFENPDSILKVFGSIHDQSQGSQPIDYGRIVEDLYRKSIYKDLTEKVQDLTHSESLPASICLQLWALGFTPPQMQQQQLNSLATEMEELEIQFIFLKQKEFDPSKKLNVMKIDMAQLEWFKKDSKARKIGYYDCFKRMNIPSDYHAINNQKKLTFYWNDMVEEAKKKPQSEHGAFRTRWLYSGTNYRRMVEPLDIAEYYREKDGERFKSGLDYVTYARSTHYKVLEEWLEEDKKEKKDTKKGEEGSDSTSKKNVELILTIDSCFWAHVEEALISYKVLVDARSSVEEKEEANKKLLEFEDYVYGMLKKYEVSPEIFLNESSYMSWWNKYKALKGTTGNAALADFMSNQSHYGQYTIGTYDFP